MTARNQHSCHGRRGCRSRRHCGDLRRRPPKPVVRRQWQHRPKMPYHERFPCAPAGVTFAVGCAHGSGENVMRNLLILFSALVFWGCDETPPPGPEPIAPAEYAPAAEEARQASGTAQTASRRINAILEAQPGEVKARYKYRHPKETLEFFGIRPGMTVVEALPSEGWYSQILVPYLGKDGRLIGANYAQAMWPEFGFFEQDFIDSMETWTTDWPKEAEAWRGGDGATVQAFEFGSMPNELAGQAD